MVEKVNNQNYFNLETIRKKVKVSDQRLFPFYLKEVYKDLIERAESNKEFGISRITFYEYLCFPVFLSDKIFNALDKDKNGFLNVKEFIEGLNAIYYGTFEESSKVIFSIYDFDWDGKINKEDVKVLFSYLPLTDEEKQIESLSEIDSIIKNIRLDSQDMDYPKFAEAIEKINSDLYIHLLYFLYNNKPFSLENIEICKNLKKYIQSVNSGRVEDGFYSPEKKPLKDPLREGNIATPTPTIYIRPIPVDLDNELSEFALNDIDNSQNEKDEPKKKSTFVPSNIVHEKDKEKAKKEAKEAKEKIENLKASPIKVNQAIRMIDHHKLTATPTTFLIKEPPKIDDFSLDVEEDKAPINKPVRVQQEKKVISKKGLIYKLTERGNIKTFFLHLCNKDVYYYKDQNCEELLGMHSLSGSFFIESVFNSDNINQTPKTQGNNIITIEGRTYYQFSIIFSNKTRNYYCKTKEEAEEWVAALKSSLEYSDFSDVYEIVKVIGEGKFGVVYLGIHKKTKKEVAIKYVKKKGMPHRDLELLKYEIDIMKMCRHPNIVRLLDQYDSKEATLIVMEYLSGDTFANYLEKTPINELSDKNCGKIVFQICRAVQYLHTFGIVHRDIKPENIMIKGRLPYETSESVKIMDFGLSKILGPSEKVNDGFGTLTYVSPEVLTRKPYNKSVDIWSIGVIVYYTLCGQFPFDDPSNDEETIAKKIVYQDVSFTSKFWKKQSPNVIDFIKQSLAKDHEKRIAIDKLVKHPWFEECGINIK